VHSENVFDGVNGNNPKRQTKYNQELLPEEVFPYRPGIALHANVLLNSCDSLSGVHAAMAANRIGGTRSPGQLAARIDDGRDREGQPDAENKQERFP
jgi:hypothetical protein